jgi:hypothetical protein
VTLAAPGYARSRRRLARTGVALCGWTFLAVAVGIGSAFAQETTASTDQLKLAYIPHFFELIEWKAEGSSLEFCAYSSSALGDQMMNSFRNRKVRNMQITTRRSGRDDPQIASCKALFIPDGAAGEVTAVLKRLQHAQTVTISSIPGFVERGGIIGFVVVGDRLRFDVNEAVAAGNGLKVSARLLEFAHRVVR